MSLCIEIAPTKLQDSPSIIRAAIQPSTVLPVSRTDPSLNNERNITPHLSKTKNWKNPKGLFGYSKDSEYKDLFAYFDYGDKKSPINELATKALSMYGLGGAMGEPNWGPIRGTVVLERIEPDYGFSPWCVYKPKMTVEEIYDTLIFFRDSKLSARKIATKRDSARMIKGMTMPDARGGCGFLPNGQYFQGSNEEFMRLSESLEGGSSGFSHYVSPTGEWRKKKQVDMDQDKCDHCGKMQSLLGKKLKKCTVCQVTFYCGKDCQKAAWKKHKKVCKSLSEK